MDLLTSNRTPIPSSAPPPPSPSSASPAALPPLSSEIGKPVIFIFTPQKILVMEDFSCPFCLVKCASYKGLRLHLPSSHDLFNFEFWANEEYQAVNVSVNTDQWRSEIVADGVDPKLQTFLICSNPGRRSNPKCLALNANDIHPLVLDYDLPATINEHRDKIDCMIEVDDVDSKFNLHFPPREVDVEEGKYKRPKRKSQYSSCSEAGLWEVASKFGYSSEQFRLQISLEKMEENE